MRIGYFGINAYRPSFRTRHLNGTSSLGGVHNPVTFLGYTDFGWGKSWEMRTDYGDDPQQHRFSFHDRISFLSPVIVEMMERETSRIHAVRLGAGGLCGQIGEF